VTFVMNLQVSDGTKSARGRTRRVVRLRWYARRWGIENSSKSIKDLLSWTTSRNTAVRVFDVGFVVILDHIW
jgi:IS4 transposase